MSNNPLLEKDYTVTEWGYLILRLHEVSRNWKYLKKSQKYKVTKYQNLYGQRRQRLTQGTFSKDLLEKAESIMITQLI